MAADSIEPTGDEVRHGARTARKHSGDHASFSTSPSTFIWEMSPVLSPVLKGCTFAQIKYATS
ncbi:hypothetical protein EYF80_006565 [Liparis tanakae]|uniref:Uncharacterized protein n=1 Tax=Liparis tanakae TaxID=230148 RepID=A0A4Z2J123_9TELE|nr:hypothetical protein EYF80_006565 [Liparis tanakae]